MSEFTLPPHEFDEIFERRFVAGHDCIFETCVPAGEAPATRGAYGIDQALMKVIRHEREWLGIPRLERIYRKHRFNPFRPTSGLKLIIARNHEIDARLRKAERAAADVSTLSEAQQVIDRFKIATEISRLPERIVFDGARLKIGDPLFYVTFWGADLPVMEVLHVTGYGFDHHHSGAFRLIHKLRAACGREEVWGSDKVAGLRNGTYRGNSSNKEPFLEEAAARTFAIKTCRDHIAAIEEHLEIFDSRDPIPQKMSIWRKR